MIPYLTGLVEITVNNGTIRGLEKGYRGTGLQGRGPFGGSKL